MEQTPIRTPESTGVRVPAVELQPSPETQIERPTPAAEQSASEFSAPIPPVVPDVAPTVTNAPVSPSVHQAIENILSEGLQLEYEQLDPATQEKFRTVGESTATQIESLLGATKIQIQKIIGLIMDWLKILPGVNTFFIQQEAKIKADKLLKLRE
jgi:hypothetical protein